ncbi:MAG: hypothetical protein QM784_19730 [Polyangiaceae bacterium]
MKTWGLSGAQIDKGVSGPYVAAVHFEFESQDSMNAALGPGRHRRRDGRHHQLHHDPTSHPDLRDRRLKRSTAAEPPAIGRMSERSERIIDTVAKSEATKRPSA